MLNNIHSSQFTYTTVGSVIFFLLTEAEFIWSKYGLQLYNCEILFQFKITVFYLKIYQMLFIPMM